MIPLVVRSGAYPHEVDRWVSYERDEFAKAGIDYLFTEPASLHEHQRSLERCVAFIVGAGTIGPVEIRALTPGVLLLSCSIGLDHIDLGAARDQGVIVANMPDLCTDEVADHTIALMLACLRQIPALDAQVRSGTWSRSLLRHIPRLGDLTLGIVGYGRIGQAVAGRAAAFGMKVIAHDVFAPDPPPASVELVELMDLCSHADVITCHVPAAPGGQPVLRQRHFEIMKSNAVLINTSRGSVIDEVALVASLQGGRLGGAGLDVLESEPPAPDHPLFSLPNVVITPHAGGYSDRVVTTIPRLAVDAVLGHLAQATRN